MLPNPAVRCESICRLALFTLCGLFIVGVARAHARDQSCDPAVTNCRTPLLNLIDAETVEIDVGMWFMEDSRYATAIIARKNAGVKVRIIFDTRSDPQHPSSPQVTQYLVDNGIPMRRRTA